jgi:broad specificity phosphatase PhoE
VPVAAPELLVVRHARSVWNEEGRWQGHADPPLSPRGETEAKQAATDLSNFDLVVSSDLQRARRTAELLSGRHPDIIEAGLRELDVGAWSGLTRSEILRTWPHELAEFDARQLDRPPGGETRAAFERRILETAGRLTQVVSKFHRVLIVSHGGVIRVLAGRPLRPVPQLSGYKAVVIKRRILLTEPVELLPRDANSSFPEAVRSEP